MSSAPNPIPPAHTTMRPRQPLSTEEMEYLFPDLTFPQKLPTLAQQSWQRFMASRRLSIRPEGSDPVSFVRQHSFPVMLRVRASLALIELAPMIGATAGPAQRFNIIVMRAMCFLNDMFPFHRKFFDSVEVTQWESIFKFLWVLAKVKSWYNYKNWLQNEEFDDPKQLTMRQYHTLRINPPFSESHFVSCAPALKPTYSTVCIRVIEPFNIAYRLDRPPRVPGWYEYYLTPDNNNDNSPSDTAINTTMEPGALTPATNPGAPKPHEMKVWFSQGGAVLDPSQSWTRYVLPQPAESVDGKPDWSNAPDDDDEQYLALLEFRADPEASLMRRVKEKLGFLSKKERGDVYKRLVERQREELELDALRELNGQNAADAAVWWELDEQESDDDDGNGDKDKDKDEDDSVPAAAAVPGTPYGYVPAHPFLSERETWDEFFEYYYSLSVRERNLFLEGLAWYCFNLALHMNWYAIRQEEAEAEKAAKRSGEAAPQPDHHPAAAPKFPPNPAAAKGLADDKPNLALAFRALPWANHFMTAAHLAAVTIKTTTKMVAVAAREAKERAREAADYVRALGEAECRRVLAELDETFTLVGDLGETLGQAEALACKALSRATEARIFDPDTDELTDYEDGSEVEGKKKKKKKKTKAKKAKKDKAKAKATGDETHSEKEEEPKPKSKKKKTKKAKAAKAEAAAEDPLPAPPSPSFFDNVSLLAEEEAAAAGPSTATTIALPDLSVPGYGFARVPDAFTTSAAGLGLLAARDKDVVDHDEVREFYYDSRIMAARWEDEEEAAGEHRRPRHARDAVTGREGLMVKVKRV